MAFGKTNDAAPWNRPRTVTLTGFLLMIEWFGFLVLGIFHMAAGLNPEKLTREAVKLLGWLDIRSGHAQLFSIIFLMLALMSLIAAVGFFRMQFIAWLLATTAQGVSLLTAVILYFTSRPAYIYIDMLYCIVIVSYLNYPEVQEAFRSREADFCKRARDECR
ncbi:MAG: hypothetical protein ACYC9O_10260 [Candidatus Latescibacterota bacterium]